MLRPRTVGAGGAHVLAAGVLSLLLWAFAHVGQKLGAAQMNALHAFLRESPRRASEGTAFANGNEAHDGGCLGVPSGHLA